MQLVGIYGIGKYVVPDMKGSIIQKSFPCKTVLIILTASVHDPQYWTTELFKTVVHEKTFGNRLPLKYIL